jgi:hypothetical protein
MATVQKFDHSMIEKFLRSSSLKFLRDSDGDFVVQFGYSDKMGCELDIFLVVEGSKQHIYRILGIADKRIQKNDWGRAIMVCNTWNKERRWPKAYLYVKDAATDTTGSIRLEQQVDLETGIHQELLDDFSFTSIGGILQFWEWAHQEQGL